MLRLALLLALMAVVAGPARAQTPAMPAHAPYSLIAVLNPSVEPLISLLEAAQSRIYIETQALNDTQIAAVLSALRARGVDVRVMVDPNSASSAPVLNTLVNDDVWTRRGNPAFAATGESAVVIDGDTLVVLNAPITVEALSTQERFLVVDHDATDVEQATSVFLDDWERRTPTIFGQHTVLAPETYMSAVTGTIGSAGQSLDVIADAVQSPEVLQALTTAGARGVRVRLLLEPGVPVATLFALQQAGIAIGQLGVGFIGEALAADGTNVLVGSASLNDQSLQQQRELGISLQDAAFGAAFTRAFDSLWRSATVLAPIAPTATPRPTATPTHTPTPGRERHTPTAAPTAATTPPAGLTLLPSFYGSVRIGGTQEIDVQTTAGAAVSISVTYPDGTTSNQGTAQGHGTADARGLFVDSWVISPSTTPGTARVTVTVSEFGQTKSITFAFTITL
jgi:hypothetical protein